MKKLLIIISIFVLTGFTDAERQKMEFTVKAFMNYPPDSIDFKQIHLNEDGIWCGYVNAKDEDNKDVGYSPFYSDILYDSATFANKYRKELHNPKDESVYLGVFASVWEPCVFSYFYHKSEAEESPTK